MKNLTNNSSALPFKLNKNTQAQIWACVIPMLMAVNCFFLRVYLRYVSQKQCPPSGVVFDYYRIDTPTLAHAMLFDDNLPCTDSINQFLYKTSGLLIYIFLGLSIMLPWILMLRHRPVKESKLF